MKVEDISLLQKIDYVKYRGTEKVITSKPKYQRVTMHTARHSYINNLKYVQRFNITEAGELAGHSSYKTTERYYERESIDDTLMRVHINNKTA